MPEAELVRGVRGAQCGVGGEGAGAGAGRRERRGRLLGQRLDLLGRGEVVAGLVAGGQQGLRVRVGAVVGEPFGPAEAAAAGQQGDDGLVVGECVEAVEAGRRSRGEPVLPRYAAPRSGRLGPRRRSDGRSVTGQRGLLGRKQSSVIGVVAGAEVNGGCGGEGEGGWAAGDWRNPSDAWGEMDEKSDTYGSGGRCGDTSHEVAPGGFPAVHAPRNGVSDGEATLTTPAGHCPTDARFSPG
ncbi:hypothetical protein GCM10010341_41670 [Streptomyces noursei]|nr:hypothetical protein GCM10010341_41670 [Streptomyces noursei]